MIDSDYKIENFPKMRAAGRLAAKLLDYITPFVQPGVSTGELDRLCEVWTQEHNAISAPLGYDLGWGPYPKSVCISKNAIICHGIPSDAVILNEGDIVNIDVTPILDGWFGDSSRTFHVGKVKRAAERLVECTHEAMMAGIAQVKPGATTFDIGKAIQAVANKYGYGHGVVREFSGHGIGTKFHQWPSILHFHLKEGMEQFGRNVELIPGMIFTVEPMINQGSWKSKLMEDKWGAKTRDRALSAQFEHTVGVTEDGVEIFTLSPKGWHKPPYIITQ